MQLIPQFPLKLVVFPDEKVNLHIFEERYKQLISDCYEKDLVFGIPYIQKDKSLTIGTTVKITKINKSYSDGKLDISTLGVKTYTINSLHDPMPEKLYGGAEIEYKSYVDNPDFNKSKSIIKGIKKLYKIMKVNQSINEDEISFRISQMVHKIGLTANQELHILELNNELERQDFVVDHLNHMLPIISNLELMKRKIRMNGHFKNIDLE